MYPALQFFDFPLPSYQIYLPRNILDVINEENFLSMMSELGKSKVKVIQDILLNNRTLAKEKKRLHAFIDAASMMLIGICKFQVHFMSIKKGMRIYLGHSKISGSGTLIPYKKV